MAIQKVGNKTYANIDDLPALGSIEDDDKIIVQTSSGTSVIPFKNFIIPLDNLAFKTQYQELYDNFTVTNGVDEKVGYGEINVHSDEQTINNLVDAVNQLDKNDISNYNTLARGINTIVARINTIQDIMKMNPQSFPNLPEDVGSLQSLNDLNTVPILS